jgi:hypothetical protein
MTIQEILLGSDLKAKRALFAFNKSDSNESVRFKFKLWSKHIFPRYFKVTDAPFHKMMDSRNIDAYRGNIKSFTNLAFRNAAKTARTKLFVAFCIANDLEHSKGYLKVLSHDGDNSEQFVTDVYNMLVDPMVLTLYPEIFKSEDEKKKREERMSSFTTTFGVKLVAGTVGKAQRGALQDDRRPDFIIFDDIETRTTLYSALKTNAIWNNFDEARTGLSSDGSFLVLGNYISELGNIHKLVQKGDARNVVLITPIMVNGQSTWPEAFTNEQIELIKQEADDFDGDFLCKPSASKDILFDREQLQKQIPKDPIRESAGFKMFYTFDPSSRYGSGHDVAGGVSLDSSTSVFIDFDAMPARVVGTFKSNTIKPSTFGDEIFRQADIFGGPIIAVEKNNHGISTIDRLKQLDANLYKTGGKDDKIGIVTPKEYGWHTNGATKPKMIFALAKAVEKGLIELNDKDIIAELMNYTRNDLIDDEKDPRMTTRHFDLLIATAIAWQMKDHAEQFTPKEAEYVQVEEKPLYEDIGI